MAAIVQVHELLHEEAAPRALFFLALLFSLVLLLPLLLTFFVSAEGASDARLLSRLPSPPVKLPIIGHLHLLGALPHVSLASLAAKHGPDLMLLCLGAVPTIIVSSPRAAEAVLRTHDHVFASRPRSMISDIIMYGATDSCFAPYGENFRKARKLVTMHLLNDRKVRSQRPAREEEVQLVMDKLHEGQGSFCGHERGAALVRQRHCLSRRVGQFSREEGRNKLFRELNDNNAALLGAFNIQDCFPSLARLELLDKVVCAKAKRVRKRWDQLLDKLIDDHTTRSVRCEDGAEGEQEDNDFIDVLLSLQKEYGFTRDHLKAILI
ncbi:indole-2-monooxygenase, partial [Dichanthelium oligosanthes]